MADVLAYGLLLIALIVVVVAGLIYVRVTKLESCETYTTNPR